MSVCVCVTYLHMNKKIVAKFKKETIFTTFNFSFGKSRLVKFQSLHYHLLTIILDKISTRKKFHML